VSEQADLRYFEDLDVGEFKAFEKTMTLERAAILEFSKTWDPAPYHISTELAQEWGHPDISAPGVMTEAIVVRLIHANFAPLAAIGLAGKEHMRLPTPVYGGDTLSLTSEVVDKRPSRSKPDRGIVQMKMTLAKQDGSIVYEAVHVVMVKMRNETHS